MRKIMWSIIFIMFAILLIMFTMIEVIRFRNDTSKPIGPSQPWEAISYTI
jgi:predicted RND superfamily exporter protein